MPKKVKEKQSNDTKFNVDNEIIIGIRTLPEVEPNKKKNTKKKVNKTKKNTKKTRKKQNKPEEIELKLGIEDDSIKKKKTVPKITTKKQKKSKKKKKSTLRLIKWTTLILILIAGGIYFMLSPFFNIKNIEVTGNSILTTEEIISLSQINIEENTFKLIKSKIEKSVKQNAYIENAKIKRKLPGIVVIEVEERIPTYMIAFANAYAYINNQGYFLEISKEKLDIPLIVGYSTTEESIYEAGRLCLEDLQKLDNVLQIMRSAESNEMADLVTKINISDKQNYILELSSEKKTVELGDTSDLSTKMLFIKKILEENKNIEGEILVNTDLTKGVIFRKKV